MTAALTLDTETASDALSAVQTALRFLTDALTGDTAVSPSEARAAASQLHAAADAMTTLADAAEVLLPDNVIDFAAWHRNRRERRSGGAP
jgi:hypothetical protein